MYIAVAQMESARYQLSHTFFYPKPHTRSLQSLPPGTMTVGAASHKPRPPHRSRGSALNTPCQNKFSRRRRVLRTSTSVAVSSLLLLSYTLLAQHAEAATCCVNTTSGEAFTSPCVCLVDNTQVVGQSLARGETGLYHWVLEASSSELVTLENRGNVTFKV